METVLSGCLVVFGAGAAAVLLAQLSHRFVPARVRRDLRVHGGLVSGIIAAMFAISVALVLSFSWGQLESATSDVRKEAGALVDIFWYAQTLDHPAQSTIEVLLRGYTSEVINQEWQAMAAGEPLPVAGWRDLDRLRQQFETMEPKGGGDTVRYAQALGRVTDLANARRARQVAATGSIPFILWAALVASGILVVAIPILLGNARPGVRGVLAFISAALVAFVVFLVYQINHPFSDGIRVPPTPFENSVTGFNEIEALWNKGG